jgi:signal transduction histidine kinase
MCLQIKNHGPVIPEQELSMIFEKFYRGVNNAERNSPGNGLGLYIAKSFVELMGGSMNCESSEEKGTTFFVNLQPA